MLVTFPARISFPSLHVAESVAGSDPKFGAKFIVDPADTKTVEKLRAAEVSVAADKWGAKADNIRKQFARSGKKPEVYFVEEPYRNKEGDIWNGFEDMFYVSATNAKKPLVLDQKKSPLTAADEHPRAGDYVMVQVDVWAQDNTFGRGVRSTLKVVQYTRQGESLGGGASADLDAFEEVEAEEPFV